MPLNKCFLVSHLRSGVSSIRSDLVRFSQSATLEKKCGYSATMSGEKSVRHGSGAVGWEMRRVGTDGIKGMAGGVTSDGPWEHRPITLCAPCRGPIERQVRACVFPRSSVPGRLSAGFRLVEYKPELDQGVS